VELLDEPTPVQEIADQADVSQATADNELQRLQGDNWVTKTIVDGTKAYDLNPVRTRFDEVTGLIEANSRDELESQLTELKDEQEALATEYVSVRLMSSGNTSLTRTSRRPNFVSDAM
jgi:DNA-binding MarR family transcriptional regulator